MPNPSPRNACIAKAIHDEGKGSWEFGRDDMGMWPEAMQEALELFNQASQISSLQASHTSQLQCRLCYNLVIPPTLMSGQGGDGDRMGCRGRCPIQPCIP